MLHEHKTTGLASGCEVRPSIGDDFWLIAYLCISDDVVLESLCRCRQIRMNRAPVSKKGVVVDCIYLFEENRHLDTRLVIWLRIVVQLWRGELVFDFLPGHCYVGVSSLLRFCCYGRLQTSSRQLVYAVYELTAYLICA